MSNTESPQDEGTGVPAPSTDLTIDNSMPEEGDMTDQAPTWDDVEDAETQSRTIADALDKFQLVNGAGDGETTACVMTAISWVAGEAWTDHPSCSHHLLANLAIRANDADGTTREQRAEIVRAGASGLLDTWWVPTEVVLAAIAAAPKDATQVDHALAVIEFIGAWKAAPVRGADLVGANLGGADLGGADLVGADLRGANLVGANLGDAYLVGANLRGADLVGADLRGADLVGAKANQFTRLPAGWSVVEGLIVPDGAIDTEAASA